MSIILRQDMQGENVGEKKTRKGQYELETNIY